MNAVDVFEICPQVAYPLSRELPPSGSATYGVDWGADPVS